MVNTINDLFIQMCHYYKHNHKHKHISWMHTCSLGSVFIYFPLWYDGVKFPWRNHHTVVAQANGRVCKKLQYVTSYNHFLEDQNELLSFWFVCLFVCKWGPIMLISSFMLLVLVSPKAAWLSLSLVLANLGLTNTKLHCRTEGLQFILSVFSSSPFI